MTRRDERRKQPHDHVSRDVGDGLRPTTPAACREFLRALEDAKVDGGHAAACPRCAAHAAFRAKLDTLLRARPVAPPILLSRHLLESTQERIVEAVEAESPIGQWIADHVEVPLAAQEWPQPLLDPSAVARAMMVAPGSPSAHAWGEVRKSVLAELGTRRASRTRLGLWIGAVAMAAAAILSVLLPSPGTERNTTIVFTDLDSMPGVEFSVIRYGALR